MGTIDHQRIQNMVSASSTTVFQNKHGPDMTLRMYIVLHKNNPSWDPVETTQTQMHLNPL